MTGIAMIHFRMSSGMPHLFRLERAENSSTILRMERCNVRMWIDLTISIFHTATKQYQIVYCMLSRLPCYRLVECDLHYDDVFPLHNLLPS